MLYTTSIVTIQANKFVGWPVPNPLKCEQHKTRLVVNTTTKGSMAKPYRSILNYPYYKKNVGWDTQVRVFQATIKANGKTLKDCFFNAFNYTLKEMTLN